MKNNTIYGLDINKCYKNCLYYSKYDYPLFTVMDEDVGSQEFIAFGSLPVTCIRPGIRLVNLHDGYGNKEQDFLFCSLSVRIAVSPL
jgi:hypothetical protein